MLTRSRIINLSRSFLKKYSTGPAQTTTVENAAAQVAADIAAAAPKEPLLVKWRRFWEHLYRDYKEVAIDTVTDVKARPKKAITYLAGIGSVITGIATNPDERCFREAILTDANELLLIGDSTRNPQADTHVKYIARAYNEGTLKRLNFGIFSLYWLTSYDPACAVYSAQCDYLKPRYVDMLWYRVVDVGFFGRFWLLEKKMKDYDVSPAEWKL